MIGETNSSGETEERMRDGEKRIEEKKKKDGKRRTEGARKTEEGTKIEDGMKRGEITLDQIEEIGKRKRDPLDEQLEVSTTVIEETDGDAVREEKR